MANSNGSAKWLVGAFVGVLGIITTVTLALNGISREIQAQVVRNDEGIMNNADRLERDAIRLDAAATSRADMRRRMRVAETGLAVDRNSLSGIKEDISEIKNLLQQLAPRQ